MLPTAINEWETNKKDLARKKRRLSKGKDSKAHTSDPDSEPRPVKTQKVSKPESEGSSSKEPSSRGGLPDTTARDSVSRDLARSTQREIKDSYEEELSNNLSTQKVVVVEFPAIGSDFDRSAYQVVPASSSSQISRASEVCSFIALVASVISRK